MKSTPEFTKFVQTLNQEVRLSIVKSIEDVQKIGNTINQSNLLEHLNKTYPDLSVAMISHHIKAMSAVGFVTSTKKGRTVYYSLSDKNKKNIRLFRNIYKIYIDTTYGIEN